MNDHDSAIAGTGAGAGAGSAPAAEVERLAHYGNPEQEEILGQDSDAYGVAHLGMSFLPKEIHFGIRAEDGRLVAHTGLRPVTLTVGGADLEAMGVGGVCVAPARRGQGLAGTVVTAALDHARGLGVRYALLFCRPQKAALYRGLGFREVAEAVTVEQPEGRLVEMPLRTMWAPLAQGAVWPEGPVRLRSLPF
ncbi:GNAT family N-acetyltransferase [Streptomyces sp. NRRL WC-3742]|uniref:GNAT family N-acetyltransferase n=1 Tax=Streptomyces sp. NRRL WC-3742 TaxID=1463934 RepID=UPI00068944ED|nr:GNAT family N-acetyltransferase [Streptomyces sp. NRRL WC-3742]